MKKLIITILACVLTTASCYTQEYSIVFVYIGSALPSYLPCAVKQARLFNKKTPIYIIANKTAVDKSKNDQTLINSNPIYIYCEDLPQSDAHTIFLRDYNFLPHVRDKYWIRTTERFFYIHEFMHYHNVKNVFHLENDNTLYVDLNELLPIFSTNYPGLAMTFDEDENCVPGFIYINNAEAMKIVTDYMAQQAKPMSQTIAFDMRIFPMIKQLYGPKIVDTLPLLSNNYIKTFGIKNLKGQSSACPQIYTNNIDHFNSIFDGYSLGFFLGGFDKSQDEKGVNGPGFIWHTSMVNASRFKFEWLLDEENRKVPYAVICGEKYRINNLHIHCKELLNYMS